MDRELVDGHTSRGIYFRRVSMVIYKKMYYQVHTGKMYYQVHTGKMYYQVHVAGKDHLLLSGYPKSDTSRLD